MTILLECLEWFISLTALGVIIGLGIKTIKDLLQRGRNK
jgi:hypothetical protein